MEVIRVENLSKLYDLGQVGTGTISKDLNRWWANVRGKEDPYARIGQQNDRTKKAGKDETVWALKDINFSVNQGEVVGIIGRNGAGKSTLLKIISRITSPTTGAVKVKGRIASLLEVGTGFHPEMTGRENIFMNGTLLGMTRREILSKLDEIIDFAGVEKYIDTPVKRYSSGMQVRLAFAVAAFLEPEILIVDEVLAVGDAEFQKKAIGRMKTVSKVDGRTVLFVSHNISAVQKLCSTGLLLKNGVIYIRDGIDAVISKYLVSGEDAKGIYEIPLPLNNDEMAGYATRLQIEDIFGNPVNEIPVGKPWQVRVYFKLKKAVNHFIIALGISNSMEVNLRTTWSKEVDLNAGEYEAVFKEEHLLFAAGTYYLALGLSSFERSIHYLENVAALNISDVQDTSLDKSILRTSGVGQVLNPMNVDISIL